MERPWKSIRLGDNLRVTFVAFFVTRSNSLSFEFDNLHLHCVFRHFILIPDKFAKRVYNTFNIHWERPAIASLISLLMTRIVVLPTLSRFLVKLYCCNFFGLTSSACRLLWSIPISLQFCFKYGLSIKATTFIVIFLTCINFLNVVMSSYVIL